MADKIEKGPIKTEDYPISSEGNVDLIIAHELGRRLSVENFRDVYGDERIDAAIRDQLNIKAGFVEQFKKDVDNAVKDIQDPDLREKEREKVRKAMIRGELRNKALETLVRENIEMGNWFGENAYAIRTTEYDDLKNGVDVVVEFDSEDGDKIALSIDVSLKASTVHRKIFPNFLKIKNGGAKVEFFASQIQGSNFKGEIQGVIPVAIGIDGANADAFFDRQAQMIRLEKSIDVAVDKGLKDTLQKKYDELFIEAQNDPIQLVYINEILAQVIRIAEELRGDEKNETLFRSAEKLKRIFEDILEEKKKRGMELGVLKKDLAYLSIVGAVEMRTKKASA